MIKFPDKYCVLGGESEHGGAFLVPFENRELHVIASRGGDWDHVSVSLNTRCPNWREMCFIKELFFDDEDCVIQYHPPKSKYVNYHPYCLHLWRPHQIEIPLPPQIFV